MLGLCVAVLSGEAFFRVGNLIVNKTHINASCTHGDKYRILCMGDSSTYGLGASDAGKFSYPAQLQTILDRNISSRKCEVLNLGVPGINSSQLLNRFRSNILKYKPDLVIVMVGINDPWNLEESGILKFYNAGAFRKLMMNMEFGLNRSRLFRFFRLVLLSKEVNSADAEPNIADFNDRTRSSGFRYSPASDPVRSGALYSSINENITEMLRIARDEDTDILFMKYHNSGWGNPEKIIHEVYKKLELPVADCETPFREAARRGINVRSADGWHPNDLGYLFIAATAYNRMVSLKLADGEPVRVKLSP
ncbi:MAG: hypothetical protein HZA16_02625 [Nitrospirae bacterium]|nr:hypothetical protein [Nitrospirota bacterium]